MLITDELTMKDENACDFCVCDDIV